MIENFEKIKNEIAKIILNSAAKTDPEHSKTTLEWLLKMKPDADEALQIAALAHDIERGFNGEEAIREKDWEKHFATYDEHKRYHANESARIISELLMKNNVDDEFVQRVSQLVKNHEVGGDEDENVLMDADSMSYMQSNFDYFLEMRGKNKTKIKLDYMYDRMTETGKQFGKDFYQECLNKLK